MARKVMLMGPTGCGKTALANAINKDDRRLKKTQDMMFGRYTVDVPGSYLETPWMYCHLIGAAQNHAAHILMVTDGARRDMMGAPGFVNVFTCPVTGVITKTDLGKVAEGRNHLLHLGVTPPFFEVSTIRGEGITRLTRYLEEQGVLT